MPPLLPAAQGRVRRMEMARPGCLDNPEIPGHPKPAAGPAAVWVSFGENSPARREAWGGRGVGAR